MKFLCGILFTWLFAHVLSLVSHPPSPCPGIFNFEGSEPENNRWYGEITLRSDESLVGIRLDVEVDRPSDLLVSWMGQVSASSNMKYTILNLNQRLKPGFPVLCRIMIKFNPSGGSPNIRSIRLNGRQICPEESNYNSYGESSRPQTTHNNGRPDPEFGENPINSNNNLPNTISLQAGSSDTNSQIQGVINEFLQNGNANDKNVVITVFDSDKQNTLTTINGNQQNRPLVVNNNNQQNRPATIASNNQQNQPTDFVYNNQQNQPTDFVYTNQQNQQTNFVNNNQQTRPTTIVNNNNEQNRPNSINGNRPVFVNNSGQSKPNSNRPNEQQSSNVKPNNNNQGGNSFNGAVNKQQISSNTVSCGEVKLAVPLVTAGQETRRGQWPWHVALYMIEGINLSYHCGGSLVAKNKVITAAHCVTKQNDEVVNSSKIVIYLGKYHQLQYSDELGVQTKQVTRVNVFPSYNSTNYLGDIAVLTLSSNVEYTKYVNPVCLWGNMSNDLDDLVNKEGTVVGWGYDENDTPTEELKMAKMPVVSYETCIWSYPKFYSEFTSDKTFCAGFRNGTSVCNGDSGGGMVFNKDSRWYLRGIVSITVAKEGLRVCDTNHYVVFTDVAKYLDFVLKHL